jgi:phenylalanyl-tRNA synthetase beta subunit
LTASTTGARARRSSSFSEANFRFTRGVPAKLNDIAARRAADLMRQYAGARIVPGMVDAYPVPQAEPHGLHDSG